MKVVIVYINIETVYSGCITKNNTQMHQQKQIENAKNAIMQCTKQQ